VPKFSKDRDAIHIGIQASAEKSGSSRWNGTTKSDSILSISSFIMQIEDEKI